MKRILSALVLSALLLTMLAACGNQPDETTPVATTPADTTPVETTPAQTEPPTTPAQTGSSATTTTDQAVIKGTHTSPDMHPLTDLEQAEIENAWLSQKGYRIEWYSDGRTETRHYGWRYYGRIERAILLARPTADGQSGSDLHLLVYESGEFINYEDLNYEDTLRESVERFYKDFEESILRREDLDDPYDLSGQDLPPLGECPYTEEDLSGTGFHPSDYLGTYNGYSVFKVRGVIRGMSKVQLAGVPFWWGDFYLFYAYKDGESITIDKAFNLGILTYHDLRAIAYYTYGDYFPDPY